jgi:hypothetical protein
MALVISTPLWKEKPEEQKDRIRHFVRSNRFAREFGDISQQGILNLIDQYTIMRKGGNVGEFPFRMKDLNGNWGIHLTDVAPTCSIWGHGGLSAKSDGIRGPFF